jgi:hypothetical protein
LGHSPPRRTRKQEYMRWWQGRGGRQRWAGIGNAGPVTWSLVDLYKDFGFTSFVIRPPWQASHQWLIPVILGTQRTDQEAEIRRIVVQSQPWQIVQVTLSWKYLTENRAGGVACLASVRPWVQAPVPSKQKRPP